MRLGISSYTYVWSVGVPGFPQPTRPLTAPQLIDRAAELGVRVVQIADNLPLDRLSSAEIDSLRKLADEHDVSIEVGTCGIEPEHLRTYLKLAERLGSPIVRLVIDTASSHPSEYEIVTTLRGVLSDFDRAGVTLAIENHDRIPAATLAEIIVRCGSPHLGICLDTANSLACGEDFLTVLCTLHKNAVNLHVKDFQVKRLPHKKGFIVEGCPAGAGLLDIPSLLEEVHDWPRKVSAAILELWPAPEATIEESIAKEEAWARQSIHYLRQWIKD